MASADEKKDAVNRFLKMRETWLQNLIPFIRSVSESRIKEFSRRWIRIIAVKPK